MKCLIKIHQITSQINSHTDENFKNLNTDIKDVKNQVQKDKTELSYIKRKIRKKNLIIYGVDEPETNYNELESYS